MLSIRTQSIYILSLICFLGMAGQALATSYSYEGSLTCANGITATAQWDSPVTKLEWNVTFDNSSSFAALGYPWLYSYELTVAKKSVSHFIIEVSDTFTMDNLYLVNGATIPTDGLAQYDVNSNGSSNPLMPGVIRGIKFEEPYADSTTHIVLSFYSDRAPVWGDFYAKDGNNGPVVLFNDGFTANDVDPDALPANGSVNGHILVPDSVAYAPEPSLLVLLSLGGLGLLRKKRCAG